jgi:hypothetical protein
MQTPGLIIVAVGLLVLALLAMQRGSDPGLTLTSPMYAGNAQVVAIARAIARAEGFYVAGSKPQRYNNPCDISDASGVIKFPTIEEGWSAAYRQIDLMLSGASGIYRPEMPVVQVAALWTLGKSDDMSATVIGWARTVAGELGIQITDPLTEVAA